jgi:putative ABC transport system permease protein
VQRALFNAYPTVTVINIADVIETIQGVVQQITIVVRFLAAFSILAGAVILASSIASTQFRRVREVVVLKTLGAKRNHIAAVFSVEFIVLGLLAGFVGVIFANLLSRVLLHRLDVAFHIEWLATAIALVGTAVLATATGWPEAPAGSAGGVGVRGLRLWFRQLSPWRMGRSRQAATSKTNFQL